MSKPACYPPLGQLGDGEPRVSPIPLAKVLSRLVDCYEEPLARAAMLPGYADYEAAVADHDWPATCEPLVLLKMKPGKPDESWGVISGLHVLAAAKKVGKPNIPCFFVAREQIGQWMRANVEGGLSNPPRASDADEEELIYRAHWR